MKPIIGIAADCKPDNDADRSGGYVAGVFANYAEAIARAGGAPLILPPHADVGAVAGVLHGLLIPGGRDIEPERYGQAPHALHEQIAPDRIAFEERLLAALPPRTPVLGICYGCQLLNVLRGGSLDQHIPDSLGHDEHASGAMHGYRVLEGSRLHGALGSTQARGRSYHHQAIDRVADSLRPVAWHEDGTIEAVEDRGDRWVLGVQWHPERSLDEPTTFALFRAFVTESARAWEAVA